MYSEQWEAIHKTREWGTYPDNHLVRFVMRNRETLGTKALDVGCGIGAQSFFLLQRDFDVTGIDVSPTAIAKAEQYFKRVDFRVCSVTRINAEDNDFDFVVDVCCLQHIPDPEHITALQEINRVLKPGGTFFSITAKWDHSHHRADTPIRTMRRDDLIFTQCGFDTVSVDQSSFSDRNGADWICHWIIVCRKRNET